MPYYSINWIFQQIRTQALDAHHVIIVTYKNLKAFLSNSLTRVQGVFNFQLGLESVKKGNWCVPKKGNMFVPQTGKHVCPSKRATHLSPNRATQAHKALNIPFSSWQYRHTIIFLIVFCIYFPAVPFQQLPYLEVDGKKITQSEALCRYIAKQLGMTDKKYP